MFQETILIVDDEPANLGVLLESLENADLKVLVATNGELALQTLTHVRPDLILLDVMMPGINGFETCRRLKTSAATSAIPIIFMTALTDPVDEVQGLALGAVDYITKPFQVQIVLARIRTHLTVRQMQQRLEEQNCKLQQEIAERKRAEDALAEERNLLQTVIDHIPDYIFVKDAASRFTLNNKAHQRVLNAAGAAELFGETDFDRFPQELAAGYYADEQAVLRSGKPLLNREETTFAPDGSLQWLLTTKVPLRNRQGAVIGLVGISHDITRRKQREDLFRKYERIVAATADYISLVDRNYCYQIVNVAYLNASNKRPEAILGHPMSEFIGVEAFETVSKPSFDRCLAGETLRYETWVTFEKPGRRFLSVTYSPYVDVDDAITGVVISARDITERKWMEQVLRESEQRLVDIIEFLPDATLVIDAEGKVMAWNKAMETMTGVPAAEIIGQGNYAYALPFYGERRPILIDLVNRPQPEIEAKYAWLSRQGHVLTGEAYMPHLGGGEIYLSGKAAALYDSQGSIVGAIESVRDITERKQAEEQLRAAHQELQAKNEQLRELNASKDKFFSIISHDLRSPFTALLGYIELMEDQAGRLSPEKLQNYLGKLRVSADRLFALLENLLTWSRVQRGVMEYRPERIALRELAADNCDLFSANAERKQITLRNVVAETVVVSADYAMVNTVLRNLVSNALKFTPAGGQITISAQPAAQAVIVAVADTGTGMSQEAMDTVFRIDAKYSTVGTAGETGTGLGLLLCHDLVKKNGGQIRIESELGKGTTFRLTLPAPAAP